MINNAKSVQWPCLKKAHSTFLGSTPKVREGKGTHWREGVREGGKERDTEDRKREGKIGGPSFLNIAE